jgi:glutathione S-transferase
MALRFKRRDYRIKNVHSPMEAKRFNPRGRVPVLRLGDETHVDSSDILDVLDRRFPDPPLEPPEAGQRALVKILEDWADEVVYFYGLYLRFCVPEGFARMKRHVLSGLPAPMRWIAPIIARRETSRRAAAQGVGLKGAEVALSEVRDCYRAICDLLGSRPFLVGERITRADLAVASVVDQHRIVRLTPELAAELEQLPTLTSWLDRVHEQAPSAAEPAPPTG